MCRRTTSTLVWSGDIERTKEQSPPVRRDQGQPPRPKTSVGGRRKGQHQTQSHSIGSQGQQEEVWEAPWKQQMLTTTWGTPQKSWQNMRGQIRYEHVVGSESRRYILLLFQRLSFTPRPVGPEESWLRTGWYVILTTIVRHSNYEVNRQVYWRRHKKENFQKVGSGLPGHNRGGSLINSWGSRAWKEWYQTR